MKNGYVCDAEEREEKRKEERNREGKGGWIKAGGKAEEQKGS